MSEMPRLAKNTMSLNIATIANNLLAFVISVYIGRYLGKDGFGQFVFAFSFVGMFTVLTDVGLSTLFVREVARNREQMGRYSGNIIIIKLLLGIITFSLILAVITMMNVSPSLKIGVYIVAFYVILESMGKFLNSGFNAFERMEFTAFLQFSLKLLTLIGVFIVIRMKYGLTQFFGAYILAAALYLILSVLLLGRKIGYPTMQADYVWWKMLLAKSAPFAIAGFLVGITNGIDMTILKLIKGDAACGLYGAARRLFSLAIFIPANFTVALYPLFSRLYKTSRNSLVKYHKKAFQFLLIIALPLAMGTTLLARRLIILIWSNEYVGSDRALQILVWVLPIQFVTTLFGTLLGAVDKQRIVALIAFWAMIFSICFNLVLIPHFSYIGASIALLLTNCSILGLYLWNVGRQGYGFNMSNILAKPILATLAMGLCLYLLRNVNLPTLILLSGGVYVACLLLLRTFSSKDFMLIKQLLRRGNSIGE